MSKGILRCFALVCLVALAAICASSSSAQMNAGEKPPIYTYVAEWSVPRAQWADMQKGDDSMKSTMENLVSDGTLVGYGRFVTVVHTEDGATHGSWMQAMSISGLMKALDAIRAAGGSTSPVYSASKHWDFIMESTQYGYHSGTFQNSYLRVGEWVARPEAGDTMDRAMTSFLVPLLEKLLADGSIHAYQIDRQTIHTENPGAVYVVIVTNGAEGLDKFNAAIADAEKTSPLGAFAFTQTVDEAGHRDSLALVPSFTRK